MTLIALIVFAVGALGGLVLASFVLRGSYAPWSVGGLHALVGASGLVLLVLALLESSQDPYRQRLILAFVLLTVTAIGGFVLGGFHLRGKMAPKAIVALHALLALGGIVTLLSIVL